MGLQLWRRLTLAQPSLMSLQPGTSLGSYQIVQQIGAGGMGEVYRAHDHSLGRDVAVKVLPQQFADDSQRRAWLMREARAAATLNHPNICTVHAVGESDRYVYLAMEFVQGRPLSSRVAEGPLSLNEILDYGIQLGLGVGHAHDHGIVHRDLKSANVMITPDGRVKVLDFGVAKRTAAEQFDDMATRSVEPLTAPGAVVGTVPYMAPEQLRGERADARSDVWAVGVILYEMSTGRRPFQGQSGFDLASSILNGKPVPPAGVPTSLQNVVLRCLEKEPARRYQRAGELRAALETIQHNATTRSAPGTSAAKLSRQVLAAVVVVSVLVAAMIIVWRPWQTQRSEPLRWSPLTTLPGQERYPTMSPDASQVAFAWTGAAGDNLDVYVQVIGAGPPLRLTTDPRPDSNCVWSPDGRWIAFLREDPSGTHEVRLISPLGGPERRLASVQIAGLYSDSTFLTWCPDGTCLVVTDATKETGPDALFAVSLESGDKRQLTNPQSPAIGDVSPSVSPDGRALLFSRVTATFVPSLYWTLIDTSMSSLQAEPRRIALSDMLPSYGTWTTDSTEVLFSAAGRLWRKTIRRDDPATQLPFVGEDGVMPVVSRTERNGLARLIYVRRGGGDPTVALAGGDTNIWRIDVGSPGAAARSVPRVAISSTRWDGNAHFSLRGDRVAFCSSRAGTLEIWVSDPNGSNAVQLTNLGAGTTCSPRWSPDGNVIAFDSTIEGQQELYVIAASGGKPTRLTSHPAVDAVPSFSRDGQWIYFYSNRTGANEIWKIPATGGTPEQVTQEGGYVAFESADGAHLYYTSSSTLSELWRVPTSGGQRVKVLDQVRQRGFTILEKGIYYVDGAASETRLNFFDLAVGRSTIVARNLGETSFGLTASADGRVILYSRVEPGNEDIMLVENFQ